MGGAGQCGKQATSWEAGCRADVGTVRGGVTETKERQVGTTGHIGIPWGDGAEHVCGRTGCGI